MIFRSDPQNNARSLDKRRGAHRWLDTEREVGELLTKLLIDGYLVLNDIKFKYGNIDHIVVRSDGGGVEIIMERAA